MNKIIVTFDKSQEDIPTLVVAEEGWNYLSPSIVVKNVITGDRAVHWRVLQLHFFPSGHTPSLFCVMNDSFF